MMLSRTLLSSAAMLIGNAAAAEFLYNGLGVTPQMGWDDWNAFGCDVDQDLLLTTAQRIVELGLRDNGYEYIILDDCWSDGRYPNGSLRPDFTKFPNGMAYVANAVHELGMKFGMYSDAGKYTCAQYAGSLGYETIDANTFAGWGVDYLKYDNCYNEGQSGTALISYTRYNNMSLALNATGRPIFYSLCNWGQDYPWDWALTMSNSYRMSGDIYDSFDRPDARCPCGFGEYACPLPGFHCSMMNILSKQAAFPSRSQPGVWADLDQLEVGNGGMTDDEYKVHFTMWAAVKSPLIMATDMTALSAQSLSIFNNPAILALSQDPLGSSVVRRWEYWLDPDNNGYGTISMWSGNLAEGDWVVILLNAANTTMAMNATFKDIFIDDGGDMSTEAESTWDAYDLWANRMPDSVANMILESNSTLDAMNVTQYYYNATQTSYADGIAANNSLLMGTYVGSVGPLGTLTATVPRHGIQAWRLRPGGSSSTRKRDEL